MAIINGRAIIGKEYHTKGGINYKRSITNKLISKDSSDYLIITIKNPGDVFMVGSLIEIKTQELVIINNKYATITIKAVVTISGSNELVCEEASPEERNIDYIA